jgi:hypothetical protein
MDAAFMCRSSSGQMTAVEDPAKCTTNFVVLPQLAKLAIA